ncbi:hypothetical protein Tco_0962756, partial [Tanacetum coccineum]
LADLKEFKKVNEIYAKNLRLILRNVVLEQQMYILRRGSMVAIGAALNLQHGGEGVQIVLTTS